jgi:substrate import-associated zinc metallohydrolase lipoprotein
MKLNNKYTKFLFLANILLLNACSNETPLKESQLDISKPNMTDLDKWVETNYLNSYNIRVVYKWDQNAVDQNRFLFPPTEEKVQSALEIVQKIWLQTYSTVGGADFVKKIAPREIVLVGGRNMNTNGTITLGLAEAGQRISLFETDFIDRKKREDVKRFIRTIQHEYVHILNQYKPIDEKSFSKISTAYTSNWYAISDAAAREKGFISAYAQSNFMEDFAEMGASMLVDSKAEYEALINGIKSQKAKDDIRLKETLVVKYFKEAYKVDFNQLRAEAEKNTNAVIQN